MTTGISATTGASYTAPGSTKAAAGLAGGDFKTFLKMLTAQIRNQDPMNPMEGSDFAVQLATFSGVEQQVKTNDLLSQIAGQTGAESLVAYSDWIGRQVRSSGQAHFGDKPLVVDIRHDPMADRVVLVTSDRFGREVTAEDIGAGQGLIEWFGLDATGAKLPEGLYSFAVESYRGDKLLGRTDAATYGTVTEVQRSGGKLSFTLEGGAAATLDQIDALAAGGSE